MSAFAAALEVIHFWFSDPSRDQSRVEWFRKSDTFDAEIRSGGIDVAPRDEDLCVYCAYADLCRFAGKKR